MFTVNRNPSAVELRKFGWAMLFGFSLLAAIAWWLHARKHGIGWTAWTGGTGQIVAAVLVAAGVVLAVVGVLCPVAISKPVYVGWMSLTIPIGMVMSTIMLTLLFVILLPIFSLIVRTGDPLRKKLGGATYWEDYKHYDPTLERMGRPF